MDLINVINNINIESNNLFINNSNNNLSVTGLEQIYPQGMPICSCTLFYGDTESGKSLLSLNIIDKNKHLTFTYVDTHMQINKHFNNMLLLRSNYSLDILSFFKTVDRNLVDVIILDDLSYIRTPDENDRVDEMNEFLSKLFNICNSKNISLILLNTVNGEGNMYFYRNSLLLQNSSSIIELFETGLDRNNIIISGEVKKSRYVNRGNVFEFEAERM